MKTKELPTIWGTPEPSRLTPKQLSIRLPILVSAKIQALCDLFPRKTKTEIIGDLLDSALEALEDELPMTKGEQSDYDEQLQEAIFVAAGIRGKYLRLTKKYLKELEKEADVKEPMEFCSEWTYSENEFKKWE